MDYTSIKPLFEKAKVSRALLIDDAFDPAPAYEQTDLQNAFSLIEGEDAVEAAYLQIGGAWPCTFNEFSSAVGADQPLQTQLRSAILSEPSGPLGRLATAIFGQSQQEYLGKRAPLEALCSVLKEVGIETKEVGSTSLPGDEKFPLIFLDYYLGEDGIPSIDRSIEKIRTVLKSYKDDEQPIVVLMSSALKNDQKVEEFRRKADLLGCQFHFVSKEKFTGATFELISLLADRSEVLSQSRILSEFIKAWKTSLNSVVDSFGEELQSIDLQDLYFIWKKAGEGKNKRFGEHVSALFDGFLRKMIEDEKALRSVTEKVNGLAFSSLPPSPMVPSPVVAKLAHAAAFRDLEPFPEDYAGTPLGIDLGELFIADVRKGRPKKRELKALMVISQACDLEHEKSGTVLLIEGSVFERTASTRPNNENKHVRLQVDIFQFLNDQQNLEDLIIEWDAQRLLTFPREGFHKEMRARSYERVGRLRPLHALAMQQKFASQLTRVGMPDGLPVYRYGSLEVLVLGPDAKTFIPLMTSFSAAEKVASVIGDEQKHMVIMDHALDKIRAALKSASPGDYAPNAIEALRKELDDVSKLRKVRQAALDKSHKAFGSVYLRDAETKWDLGTKPPAKALLLLNFHPG